MSLGDMLLVISPGKINCGKVGPAEVFRVIGQGESDVDEPTNMLDPTRFSIRGDVIDRCRALSRPREVSLLFVVLMRCPLAQMSCLGIDRGALCSASSPAVTRGSCDGSRPKIGYAKVSVVVRNKWTEMREWLCSVTYTL
jgi:hypothetical protein